MLLYDWAARHGVSLAALNELRVLLGAQDCQPEEMEQDRSEKAISNGVRLVAGSQGWPLWRNNVGALKDEAGKWMRFGLANDSPAVNKRMKSSDLIGCRPITITSDMVGKMFGQFVALEMKKGNWVFKGTEREVAQLAFINRVNTLGGWARFVTDPEQIR